MDFIEVIIEQRRMCNTVKNCENCPLCSFHCSLDNCKDKEELREYANRVMNWTREHPRYPTIGEFFDSIKTAMGYDDNVKFDTIANCSIPQDVAREFGIMPIHIKYEQGEWAP